MTDLTDKWKKGELPNGMYYIEFKDGDIAKDVYAFGSWGNINEHFLGQVLAPVPNYEEWQASENYIDYLKQCISVYESKEKQHTDDAIAYNELVEENAKLKEEVENCEFIIKSRESEIVKLKELLKECKALLSCLQIDDYDGNGLLILTKINQVLGEDE